MGFASKFNRAAKRSLRRWLGVSTALTPVTAPVVEKPKRLFSPAAMADLAGYFGAGHGAPNTWKAPAKPRWVEEWLARRDAGTSRVLAMDSVPFEDMGDYAMQSSPWSEGLGFLGYAYLAELWQRPEYRRISEIWAAETTRKWIKLKGDDPERVSKLEDLMRKFGVREKFREAVELDGGFGRSHIFMDFGDAPEDRKDPLGYTPETIPVGSLKNLKVVEPFWCYPLQFNTTDPLADDFYAPTQWQVMGATVHNTRMLTFVGRELPDMLKPVYMFGGLSLAQMAKPYIDNFIRNRSSVANLLYSFSTMVLSTNMTVMMTPEGAQDLIKRIQTYVFGRDNGGLMVVDKETEDLTNVSAPITGVDKLLAQAQEFISSVVGIPLVVLLGVTPSGLNASSDGELQAFHDHIKGYQEKALQAPLHALLRVLQLHLDGNVDESVTFEFLDLGELGESDRATIRQTNQATDVGYIQAGVLDPEDVRKRLENEEGGLYFGLKLQEPAPEEDYEGEDGPGGAEDAWREEQHPRDPQGRFDLEGGSGNSVSLAFHGTAKEFSEFRPSEKGSIGPGVYLSPDYAVAKNWSPSKVLRVRVHGALLDLAKPLPSEILEEVFEEYSPEVRAQLMDPEDGYDWGALSAGEKTKLVESLAVHPEEGKALHKVAKAYGYVGLTHPFNGGPNETVVFDPQHAKIEKKRAEDADSSTQHWITVHPNGPDSKGEPLLISGSGTVVGGAGGKLNGKTLEHVRSMSGERQRGNKPERPAGHVDPVATEEHHQRPGETKSDHAHRLSERANTSGIAQHHEEAARAHHEAYEELKNGDDWKARSAHRNLAEKQEDKSSEIQHGPSWASDLARRESAKANALSLKGVKDKETARAYAHAHGAALTAHQKARQVHLDTGGVMRDALYEEHTSGGEAHRKEYNAGMKKVESLERAAKKQALVEKAAELESKSSNGLPTFAEMDARHAGKSHDALAKHFQERWGLGLHKATNAARDYKNFKNGPELLELYRTSTTPERRAEIQAKWDALKSAARDEHGLRISTHSDVDLEDGGDGAKVQRKLLGHVEAALEHLERQGFDVKAALQEAKVHYAPGGTGKAIGHAYPINGNSYFSMSGGKHSLAYHQQQEEYATRRREAGRLRHSSVDAKEGVESAGAHYGPVSTIIHELVHAISQHSAGKRVSGGVGTMRRLLEENVPQGENRHTWVGQNISEYGQKNMAEAEAELGAMVTAPNYVRGTLPKAMEDHVDRIFKHKGREA